MSESGAEAAAGAQAVEPTRMDAAQLLVALRALRGAAQDAAYWDRLAGCLAPLCRARSARVLRRVGDNGWQVLGCSPGAGRVLDDGDAAALSELAPRAWGQGQAYQPGAAGWLAAAVRLVAAEGPTLALLEISQRERGAIGELLLRVQLIADLPAEGGAAPAAAPASAGGGLAQLLDLVAQVMAETEYGAATLGLVNQLAATLACDQVVLARTVDGQARVVAISHIDRFERKAENVQLLEAAVEEACDQRCDLVYPAAADSPRILLAHDRLARAMGYAHIATVPALPEDRSQPPLTLLLARKTEALPADRQSQVSVALHLLQPWLATLHRRSQGWAERAWQGGRERMTRWFSPDQPGLKLLGLSAFLALMVIGFGTWPYRIEASGELATDSVQQVSAPFDGYIGPVLANLGDSVRDGAVLARLDTRELTLQVADLQSEMRRFEAEADRARAAGLAAETQIAVARAAQAQARMERLLFQLRQAEVRAPFDGVVVEGERKELAGAPVRQGDKLFRLARIEGLYALIQVSERDVHELPPHATGELRLLGQPDQVIGFEVDKLVPIARVKGAEGGQFLLKARLLQDPQAWWRPGMTGLAQMEVGKRRILWIWTHRLVDRVRLALWW